MNPATRKTYFRLWQAACAEQGWNPKDNKTRREHTLHATQRESTTNLTPSQITALFLYLRHMAAPHDHALAREWETCKADPEKFNKLRQAEHWRKKAGYRHGNKLDRERFSTHFDEEVKAELMTTKDVNDYLMTQRARAKRRSTGVPPATTPRRAERPGCPF